MSAEAIVIEGCNTRVRRLGEGEPLLLLHGLEGSDWPPELIEQLSAGHQLIIPSHPGFGASEDPKWLRTIDDLAYFYLSLLKELSLPSVRVLGHSLGGWIAAELAIRQPQAVNDMVLVAPLGLRKSGVPTGDIFLWTGEERSSKLFHNQSLSSERLRRGSTKEDLEIQLKNNYSAARVGWEPRFFNPTLDRWAHRISCPVTLVWGDSDQVVPPSYVEVWQQKLPTATSVVVKDCGHLVHVEKPRELAAIVLGVTGK
jgi:pimeloyl-ACP methyl ester carboxylesterase